MTNSQIAAAIAAGAIIAAGFLSAACFTFNIADNRAADPATSPAATSPADGLARPRPVDQPAHALPTTPDPTRDAITQQLTTAFQTRITDLIYVAAVGRIAQAHPAELPKHLAHRENHNACLRDTLDAAGSIAETQVTEDELIDDLTTCLRQESASWQDAPPTTRSIWMKPILEAAGRAHNPARHYATLHPNPESSPSYREMAAVYRNCEQLAAPHSDLIAAQDQAELATQSLEQAVNEMGNCMVSATGATWPEPTSTPAPTPTPNP